MSRLAFPPGTLLGALALCFVGGCGDAGPKRCEITGQVLLKGQPLDEGIITFMPLDGQPTGDGATVKNGAYLIPKDKGMTPGRYRIIIIGGDGTSGGGNAEPSGRARPGATPGRERVPPEYNEKSQQIVEVKSDGPNKFDFRIP